MPLIQRLAPLGLQYWKCIDPPADAAKAIADLGVRLVVRHNFDGPEQVGGGVWANQWLDEVKAADWLPYAWGVETANEPFPGNDVPPWWPLEESIIVRELAKLGKEVIVCNRGVGHDGYYVPGARWYGAHEYDFPYLLTNTPYLTLRYRRWFTSVLSRRPDARLLLTEFGVTHAVVDNYPDVGYRSIGQSPEVYWDSSIKPYLEKLVGDDVEAAFLYQVGGLHNGEGDKNWESFECVGTVIEDRMADWYGGGRVVGGMYTAPSQPQPVQEETMTDAQRAELGRVAGIFGNWAKLRRDMVEAAEKYGYDIKNSLDGREADELESAVESLNRVIADPQ